MRNTLPPKYICDVRGGDGVAISGLSRGACASQDDPDALGGEQVAGESSAHLPSLRVLAAGIDTIYASVRQPLDNNRLADAIAMRSRAVATDDPVPWEIQGTDRTFLVQPRSQRGYQVRLAAPSLDVWLGHEG